MAKRLAGIGGRAVNDFVPNPSFSVATSTSASKTVDVTRMAALRVRCTTACVYYFNTDTTKTYPLDADVDNIIMTADGAITSVVIANGSGGTLYIQGM
jgi:hypothetical protein